MKKYGRRSETRPEAAQRQAKLRVSTSAVFSPDDVAALAGQARLDLSECEQDALVANLNAAAMHFHVSRDDQLEPTGKRLAKDLSDIAKTAKSLACKLGAESGFFPAKRSQPREDWIAAQRTAILCCTKPDAIAPRYLLRALHEGMVRTPDDQVPEEFEDLPTRIRGLVTALAVYAEAAADIAQHRQPLADDMVSPWRGKSWVTLTMSLIEIYESFGRKAGFSRNDQEPGGPFFRFVSGVIKCIVTNVPPDFAMREDLQGNAPPERAITDLIREAKREMVRLRNGLPKK